jgi:hypothetical protein
MKCTRTKKLNRPYSLLTYPFSVLLVASQTLLFIPLSFCSCELKLLIPGAVSAMSCLFAQNYLGLTCKSLLLAATDWTIGPTHGNTGLHAPALPVLTSLRTDFCSYCHCRFFQCVATKVKLSVCTPCRRTVAVNV